MSWLLTSKQGLKEQKATNNHGILYDLQVGSIAHFLGDNKALLETTRRAHFRIDDHFDKDGSQPEELLRTNTAHYCTFNLQEWLNVMVLVKRSGVDSEWTNRFRESGRVDSAIKWLLAFQEKSWPYQQITPFDKQRLNVIDIVSEYVLSNAEGRHESIKRSERAYLYNPRINSEDSIEPNPYHGVRPYWNIGLQ